jgi:hypothetical protein
MGQPRGWMLAQEVGAVAEEGEEAEVSQNLELLADFVADVAVVGLKFYAPGYGATIFPFPSSVNPFFKANCDTEIPFRVQIPSDLA